MVKTINKKNDDVGAVVHKGIIRCLYAAAVAWGMQGEIPSKLNWGHAHEFEIVEEGETVFYLGSVSLKP